MSSLARKRATYADLEAVPPHLVADIIDGRIETHRHGLWSHAQIRTATIGVFGRRPELYCLPLMEIHVNGHVIVPDMAGWKHGRLTPPPERNEDNPVPDWVMEIVFPETEALDRGPKRRIYAEAGVSFLWLLDPRARTLETFAIENREWTPTSLFNAGEAVSAAPFDAISFPLDTLFCLDSPLTNEN